MPERFTGKSVGDMDFHDRGLDGFDSIGNGHRRVGLATRIEDDAVVEEPGILNCIDDLAFNVALKILKRYLVVVFPEFFQICFKALIPIYLRLPLPEEIQIRAIDDQNFHRINLATKIVEVAKQGGGGVAKIFAISLFRYLAIFFHIFAVNSSPQGVP